MEIKNWNKSISILHMHVDYKKRHSIINTMVYLFSDVMDKWLCKTYFSSTFKKMQERNHW